MSKSGRRNIHITSATWPARSIVAGAVGLALASTAAQAQQTPTPENPDIIVTGEQPTRLSSDRFTAPLIDTPKSVTVISESMMDDRGVVSLVDALRTVPGITFNAGEGGKPAGDNLRIRGFNASSDIFVDGIRDPGSQTRGIFALERIEVVKGPDSAHSGRGSTGGTVNLVTKKPRLENFVRTNLGAGTDSYGRATLDANYAFSDGGAFRVNLMRYDADVPGRDSVSRSHKGINPSLAFGLGTPTRVHLDYYYYRTDDMPDYSIPYGRNAANTRPAGEPVNVDRTNFYGLLDRDYQKTGADISTLTIAHDFSDMLTLRNVTRYGETFNNYIVTNPDDSHGNVANGFLFRATKSRNSEATTKANVTDVSGETTLGSMRHSFAFGISFSKESMHNEPWSVQSIFGGRVGSDFYNSCSAPGAVGATSRYNCTTLANPNPHDPWIGTIAPSDRRTTANIRTRSIYGFDTIYFNDHWSLDLGLRYDDYETTQHSSRRGTVQTLVNTANFWNYQLGVVYKPASNGSLYISTGTSSTPSGNTLGSGSDNLSSRNADLEPVHSRTYEIGTKWDLLNARVRVSSALFSTVRTNARVAIEPGWRAAQATIGEQRVDGFEVGVSGYLTDRWQLIASYTKLDSEIVDAGPFNAANNGNVFPNTPENSASLWTTYQVLPGFRIGGGATFVDKRYGNSANTVWVPSYTTYDAVAMLGINEHVQLQLNVRNLTDETYYTRPYASHYAAIGPGRQVVLSMDVSFK